MATKNPMGKGRKVSDPYLVVDGTSAGLTGWTYKILKANSLDPEKPFASWFADVSSPFTFGGSDMGDTYVKDIRGTVTYRDPSVPDSALPSWLK